MTASGGRDSSGLCVPRCRRRGRSQWDRTGRRGHPGGQSEWSLFPPELQNLLLAWCGSVAVLKLRQIARFKKSIGGSSNFYFKVNLHSHIKSY